ncbi:hypothetical protein C2E23DRAFT_899873 [Lenzites betulinus]|nr:hypothetical protein C2E23DRAFT_899873 [Lenzites betulinus]
MSYTAFAPVCTYSAPAGSNAFSLFTSAQSPRDTYHMYADARQTLRPSNGRSTTAKTKTSSLKKLFGICIKLVGSQELSLRPQVEYSLIPYQITLYHSPTHIMFTRLIILAVLYLPLFAAATPLEARQVCSTGALQCCNNVDESGAPADSNLLSLLSIVLPDGFLENNCSPINVDIDGGNACTAKTLCCQDNSNGAVECVPVSL